MMARRRQIRIPCPTIVPRPALGPILIRRQARQVEWERCRTTPRRLTPSSLAGGRPEAISPRTVTGHDANLGRLVGVCAHAVLEQWDFARPREEICTVIEQVCRRHVVQDHPQLMADVVEDLTALFERFLSSEPYTRLQRSTVLGREVPFVMSLGEGQMMEGVIDLIYRLDDRIWIADYKTDDVAAEDVQARSGSLSTPSGYVFASCRECFRSIVALVPVYLFASRCRRGLLEVVTTPSTKSMKGWKKLQTDSAIQTDRHCRRSV